METKAKIRMKKFDTIRKIVLQLKQCNYKNEAGLLNKNTAFLSLKKMAKNNVKKIIVVYKNGSYNIAEHDLEASEHERVNPDYLTTIII